MDLHSWIKRMAAETLLPLAAIFAVSVNVHYHPGPDLDALLKREAAKYRTIETNFSPSSEKEYIAKIKSWVYTANALLDGNHSYMEQFYIDLIDSKILEGLTLIDKGVEKKYKNAILIHYDTFLSYLEKLLKERIRHTKKEYHEQLKPIVARTLATTERAIDFVVDYLNQLREIAHEKQNFIP